MSFILYLLILSPLPYLSTGDSEYEIIRRASIDIPFALNNRTGFQLDDVEDCDRCLCEAFRKQPEVVLFTCTKNQSTNFVSCQFYYFEIKRDEIDYPVNDTDIYLIHQNLQLPEKDDCCNTTFLIEKINEAEIKTNYSNQAFGSLVHGENNKLAAISNDTLLRIRKSDLGTYSNYPTLSSLSTVGYHGNKYYLGAGPIITIYDESLEKDKILGTLNATREITTIRFINGTQMLVGTVGNGVRIYEKDVNETFSKDVTNSTIIGGAKEIRSIGIVDNSTFYTDSNTTSNQLLLYTKNDNNIWINNPNNSINIGMNVSDLVVDNCKRLWAVEEGGSRIFIYDQNRSHQYNITYKKKGLFNLLIFDDKNYTLLTSHATGDKGLHKVTLNNVTCRPLYKKKKRS